MIAAPMPAVLPAALIPTIAGLVGGLPVASPDVAPATAVGVPPAPAADFAGALATARQAPVPGPTASLAAVLAAPEGETEDQSAGLAEAEIAPGSEQPPIDLPAAVAPWASLLVPELLRLPPPAAPPTQPAQPRPVLVAVAGGATVQIAQPARLIEAPLPAALALPLPDAKAAAGPMHPNLASMLPAPALAQLEPAQPEPTVAAAPPLWTPPPAQRAALPAIAALPAPRGTGGAGWQRSLPAAAAPPAMAELPAPAGITLSEPPVPLPPPASPAAASVQIVAAIRPRPARADPADGAGPAAVPNLPPAAAFAPAPGHVPPQLPAAPPPDAPPLARSALPDPSAPALAIASDRLGLVQVEVTGDAAGLAVSLASPAPAAPIIDAAAPRLVQDLAQAGITLSALSINGQRSDLGGGQRQPRRGPQAEAVAALGRSPSARLNRPATPSTDRFA